jgi:putative transposase
MNRVYRYRLYPTAEQAAVLDRWLTMCRILYNKALWQRQGQWERHSQRVTFKDQTHALVGLKQDQPEHKEMPAGVLEDVLKRVDLAYKAFFRRCKTGDKPGYPRSKGEGWYKSITVPRSREFSLQPPEGSKRYSRLTIGQTKAQRAALGPLRIIGSLL